MAEAVDTVRKLFQGSPKNSWDALLRQLLFWSARRFCVDRLSDSKSTIADPLDLSGGGAITPEALWETHFDLMEEFSPQSFTPYLRDWLSPEHFQSLSKSYEIDIALRNLIVALDTAVFSDSDEDQELISSLLDDELPAMFEAWLGITYAPLLFFPTPDESDEDIEASKLHSILLLMRVYKLDVRKRRTLRAQNTTVRAQIRKTRRNKQKNEEVSVSLNSKGNINHSRGGEGEDHGGRGEERQGGEESHTEDERKYEDKHAKAEGVGNQEHSEGEVHA
jgi:hypothetical protein